MCISNIHESAKLLNLQKICLVTQTFPYFRKYIFRIYKANLLGLVAKEMKVQKAR